MLNKIILIFLFSIPLILSSQPGKDGSKNVSNAVILNSYSPLINNASAGATSIVVANPSYLLKLCAGDLIMIYQAQGASINTTNSSNYGNVISYNGAGIYEFVYVKDVITNTVNLASPLVKSYSVSGMTQVIKIPQYTNLTINNGASILAKNWKDTTISSVLYRFGGLVVLHANSIINNGLISASGSGFRGGNNDTSNIYVYTSFVVNYVSQINSDGGEKGESIAGYGINYDSIGGRYGRGAPANGGGGGNGWNAGGGGGSNGDNGLLWSGQGVMVVNSSNPLTAWQLDPGYISNSNNLTNSSGGGRGGYSVGASFQNPLLIGPGNPLWGLDNRREVGGLGGRPLTNIASESRIYFGGGGGAGDENNQCGGPGGSGGGIVYLVSQTSISGNGIIECNGSNGSNTTSFGVDAPSGGGGGGSIIIKANSISSSLSIIAKGGKGGDQIIGSNECEGPGGGGSGGYVAISGNIISNVSGGQSGSSNSNLVTNFPFNGATFGAGGQTASSLNQFITFSMSSILTLTNNSPVCNGGVLSFSVSSINNATYNWTGPNMFNSSLQNPVLNNALLASTGIYSVIVVVENCPSLTSTISANIYTCTTQLENHGFFVDFEINPNPGNGFFKILHNEETMIDVEIFDAKGSLIERRNGVLNELNLEGYSKGLYFVLPIAKNKNFPFKKIIIE